MSKKNFKADIPAMNFISKESKDRVESEVHGTNEVISKQRRRFDKVPKGCKIDSVYVQTKSRRLQLLVQPLLHDALKARAMKEDTSINNLVNCILWDALEEELNELSDSTRDEICTITDNFETKQ